MERPVAKVIGSEKHISRHELVYCPRSDIGKHCHIDQLYRRPFPSFGFFVYDRQRTHTLHGKSIKYHEGKAYGRRIPGAPCFRVDLCFHPAFDGIFIFGITDAVNGGHSGYKYFSGGKRRDQRNADLPVVPQGFDDRFDGFANDPGVGIFKLVGIYLAVKSRGWQISGCYLLLYHFLCLGPS